MAERMLTSGAVSLCVQTFGSAADPAVLLIAGGAQSMVWWEDAFCRRLAAGGRLVVRYDHRDTGRSTASPPGRPDYTASDLAGDPLRILDALGVDAAHVVGLSLGGGLAQALAAGSPGRLRTLTLVATSPAGPYDGVALPGPTTPLVRWLSDPPPAPDWSDRAAVLAYRVDAERPYAGALGFDEARVRRLAVAEIDRTTDMAAAMGNHVLAAGDAWPDGRAMEDIRCPTLVLHGTADPLFPLAHGRALARSIPGARLLALDGVGHQQPPPQRWDVVVPALLAHTDR
ncbi:alpha/beta fold hydrolase [Nakamurella deserti]|uniref:alpha/beta fold hydrolase n=1 Tax=Nakamurella deserti TaxID=2164074 RepID=UPI000DBE8554|nr:alpha/beta fold hydrolase [Nakamurella deserti]